MRMGIGIGIGQRRGGSPYGADMITNGTFDANVNGWANLGRGTLTWNSGNACLQWARNDGLGGFLGVQQSLTLPSGDDFLVEYDVVTGSATAVLRFGGSTFANNTVGSYAREITSSGEGSITFWSQSDLTTILIDNVVVRPIN